MKLDSLLNLSSLWRSLLKIRGLLFIVTIGLALQLESVSAQVRHQSQPSSILTGRVSSPQDGSMEGVLVTAKKANSTIATTVVSDETGTYRFPSSKLESGRYTISIRAVGYDLDSPD